VYVVGVLNVDVPLSIEENAASGCSPGPLVDMPRTACPCGDTAMDGIQYDLFAPLPSKIVPDRLSVGVEERFESSNQREPSRSPLAVAVPDEFTFIASAV
jgi:hypothetical protein